MKNVLPRKRALDYLPGLVVLCAGLAVSYLLHNETAKWEKHQAEAAFKKKAAITANAIQRRLEQAENGLANLAAFQGALPEEPFGPRQQAVAERFLESFASRQEGLARVAWAPRVRHAYRGALEKLHLKEGGRHLVVHEPGPGGRMIPAGVRDEYFPVFATAGQGSEEVLPGYDLAADPLRGKALRTALDTGEAVASDLYRVRGPRGRTLAFDLLVPCTPLHGRAENADEVIGMIAGSLVVPVVMEEAVEDLELDEVSFSLYDQSREGPLRLAYTYGADRKEQAARENVPMPHVPGGLNYDATFDLGGHTWWALFVPDSSYLARHHSWWPLVVLVGGALFSLLLGLYLWALVRRGARIRTLVHDQTSELKAANDQLHAQMLERQRAVNQIRKLSRAMEQSASGALVINADGIVDYCNSRYMEITGQQKGDVLGVKLQVVLAKALEPHEYTEMWESVMKGRQWRHEYAWHNGEETCWIASTASPVFDGHGRLSECLFVADDITAQKDAQDQLFASEQRYRLLAEHSTDIISKLSGTGRIEYISPACSAHLGLSPSGLEGKSLLEMTHPDDRSQVERFLERVVAGEDPPPLACRLEKQDGDYLWLETTARCFENNEEGSERKVVACSRDISARMRLEEQFRQSQNMETVGRLAGGIAHDFNNFLTSIMGFAQLVKRSLEEDHPAQQYSDEIVETGRQGAALVKQLLTCARKEVTQYECIAIDELLTSLEPLVRTSVGEQVDVELDLQAGASIEADASQVRQIITNLVVNAHDAMPGGGRLTISTGREVDRDGSANGQVAISIRDTGHGMPEEVRKHCLEPFYTTKGVGHGSGLGLSTVYGIVKQAGGDLVVNSREGEGTEIRLTFPMVKQEEEVNQPVAFEGDYHGGETILLVEDNDAVRKVGAALLRELGYRVLEASNGKEGLSLCKAREQQIDMIVTDVVMPQMGGPSMVQELLAENLHFKVIFTSGYNEHPLIEESRKSGAYPFIEKPFTEEQLARVVRHTLDAA